MLATTVRMSCIQETVNCHFEAGVSRFPLCMVSGTRYKYYVHHGSQRSCQTQI